MNSYENLNLFAPQDIIINSVYAVMHEKNTKKWRFTRPMKDSCIYYILKGEYLANLDGESYHIKENDVLYIPKTSDYKADSISEEMEYIHIYFNYAPLTETTGYFDIAHVYNIPAAKKLFHNVVSEYSSASPKHKIVCRKITYEILELLLNEEIRNNKSLPDYHTLRASIKYLENNYSREDITIDYLANLSNYTPAHFINLFKKLYNTTPQKYLISLRMEKAKELLIYSSYSIIEIAEMVGYSGAAYFSAAFKTAVGCSPAQYRKNFL